MKFLNSRFEGGRHSTNFIGFHGVSYIFSVIIFSVISRVSSVFFKNSFNHEGPPVGIDRGAKGARRRARGARGGSGGHRVGARGTRGIQGDQGDQGDSGGPGGHCSNARGPWPPWPPAGYGLDLSSDQCCIYNFIS